jgi:hypothetical protein
MSKRDRVPLHPLAVVAIAAGLVGMAFIVVSIAGIWFNPYPGPGNQSGLWLEAWINRWSSAALGAALVGFFASIASPSTERSEKRGIFAQTGLTLAMVSGCLAVFSNLIPVFLRQNEAGLKAQCLANIHEVAVAINMYANDWDRFPSATKWSDRLEVISKVKRGIF